METLLSEHHDGQLVAQTDRVERLAFAHLVGAIPAQRAYTAWCAADGEFRIGVGHAWRMMSSSGDSGLTLSSLKNLIQAAAGDLWHHVSYAFAWSHFDPSDRRNAADERWQDFAPVEVSIPEISFVWKDGALSRTIICDERRFENVLATAESIQKRALRAMDDVRPGDLWSTDLVDDDQKYEAVVAAGLTAIDTGLVEKVVLARALTQVGQRDIDIPLTLHTLLARYPDCFVFAIRPGGSQHGPSPVFLGATPERLVRVTHGRMVTEALAGSAPRGVSSHMDERLANDLLRSDKDRHEHDVVCARVEEALEDHVENLKRGAKQVKRLRNVQHLHTAIEADLRPGVGVIEIVEALHPTPAVGGHPQGRALALIREIEPFPRGLYAGTAGWFDSRGDGEFGVLIRSGLISGNEVVLYAGAGIVAGSEPELEARETRVKLGAVLESLR
ncbi:MAG: isochorismate synthase [bacterium]